MRGWFAAHRPTGFVIVQQRAVVDGVHVIRNGNSFSPRVKGNQMNQRLCGLFLPLRAEWRRSAAHLLVAVCAGFVSACSAGSSSPAPGAPREVEKASLPVVDESERELLAQAKKHFAHGLYTTARERFQTLRTSYPDGPYAEYALLKIADTQFFAGAFTEAVAAYDEYQKSYPGSSAAPYALFQQARSNMLSIKGVGRDTGPVERAVELFDQLKTSYPTSPYAQGAVPFRNQALELLAQQDALIGSFYEKQLETTAARRRDEQRRGRLAARTGAVPADGAKSVPSRGKRRTRPVPPGIRTQMSESGEER